MDNEEVKSAVITVLTAFRDDFPKNPLMRDGIENYAVSRIEKAMRNYDKGLITAREALEIGINPLKMPLELQLN